MSSGNGTQRANASETAREIAIKRFTIPQREQALYAVLELISKDPELQEAYKKGEAERGRSPARVDRDRP